MYGPFLDMNKLRDPSVQNWTGKAYQWQSGKVSSLGPRAIEGLYTSGCSPSQCGKAGVG